MFKTLTEGITRNGMASYSYLPAADRFALIHYVRTFNPAPPADTGDELQQLDLTYQLSKGVNAAGQIPVRKAMQRVLADQESLRQQVRAQTDSLARYTEEEGVRLLMNVTQNQERTIAAFLANRDRVVTLADFRKCITANPLALGFRTAVLMLSDTEWSLLYRTFVVHMTPPES